MPEPVSISEPAAPRPPDKSRRAVVIATVGIVSSSTDALEGNAAQETDGGLRRRPGQ